MKKIFWQDPYITECTATVTAITGSKVRLDASIFFAFSGGQASDEGTIAGIKVVNAAKQGDREDIIGIEYELESAPQFKVGDQVDVKIDGQRRMRLMRLHSAAHIVYYFVTASLGAIKIIGSNIAPDKARFDFLNKATISEMLPMIEEQVNNFLAEGHDILTVPDEKKPDMRWWSCYEWKMPCGGTHVKNTKEIGKIALKRKNIGAGKERVEITLIQ